MTYDESDGTIYDGKISLTKCDECGHDIKEHWYGVNCLIRNCKCEEFV